MVEVKASINDMCDDVNLEIFKYISNSRDMAALSRANRYYYNIYKSNKELFKYKLILDFYKVEYADPDNFIYKDSCYNYYHIDNKKYLSGNKWLYSRIYKLYMRHYYKEKITCSWLNITSFPVYPNMVHFEGHGNKLTSFPVQPKMEYFKSDRNQIPLPVKPLA